MNIYKLLKKTQTESDISDIEQTVDRSQEMYKKATIEVCKLIEKLKELDKIILKKQANV